MHLAQHLSSLHTRQLWFHLEELPGTYFWLTFYMVCVHRVIRENICQQIITRTLLILSLLMLTVTLLILILVPVNLMVCFLTYKTLFFHTFCSSIYHQVCAHSRMLVSVFYLHLWLADMSGTWNWFIISFVHRFLLHIFGIWGIVVTGLVLVE